MTTGWLKSLFWSLPWGMRRSIYRYMNQDRFDAMASLRLQGGKGNTIKPFDENKCIFVHIPKTGGISIATSLFNALGGGHLWLREYQILYTKAEFDSYFKFAFVRNPWDRLVSAYTFLMEGGCTNRDKEWARRHQPLYPTFDHFVKGWVNRANVESYILFVPQHRFICTDQGPPRVDYLGLYEHLNNDFDVIKHALFGEQCDRHLLALNRTHTRRRDYKDYYTNETERIVAEVYADDIHRFGYTFDNSTLEQQLRRRPCRFPRDPSHQKERQDTQGVGVRSHRG